MTFVSGRFYSRSRDADSCTDSFENARSLVKLLSSACVNGLGSTDEEEQISPFSGHTDDSEDDSEHVSDEDRVSSNGRSPMGTSDLCSTGFIAESTYGYLTVLLFRLRYNCQDLRSFSRGLL